MTVSAVESSYGPFGTAGATGTTDTGPTTSTSVSEDKDLFLQLLVAQMRYQDPSNPTDSSEFLAQTAQFTALEKMQLVADQTQQLVGLQTAFGAGNMVGQTVSYVSPDGATLSGTVSAVRFEPTGPVLQVDGQDVQLGAIKSIGEVPLAGASVGTGGSTTGTGSDSGSGGGSSSGSGGSRTDTDALTDRGTGANSWMGSHLRDLLDL